MRRGTNPWSRFDRFARKTFREAAKRYLAEIKREGIRDVHRQVYALQSVLPYIGDLPLIDVDGEALEAFIDDRKAGEGPFKKPVMVGTINKELSTVTTVLNRAARDWRWIPGVPRIRHLKGEKRQAYPLTWDEQDRLFSKLPQHWADLGAAVFAVNTGVRKAELFGLRWTDLQNVPELDTFVFVLSNTKNGHPRAVICNSLARRAVDKQRGNGSKFVFPSHAGPNQGGCMVNENKVWRKAWVDAGLPSDPIIRKGIHNLRHTFGHRLRACGVPDEDRDALLGHANKNLTQHYATPDIERLLRQAEKITKRRETTVLRALNSVA